MTEAYLVHHGIKGQKWGVRRFENEDGTLTPAGKKRYASDVDDINARTSKRYSEARDKYIDDKNSKTYGELKSAAKAKTWNTVGAALLDDKARSRHQERIERGDNKAISAIKGRIGTNMRTAGRAFGSALIGATLAGATAYISSGGDYFKTMSAVSIGAYGGAAISSGKTYVKRILATAKSV